MARDAVAITNIPQGTPTANPAGTAITPANGQQISMTGVKSRRLLVRVTNTSGSDRIVTIEAGAYPPAQRASLGALTFTVVATTGDMLIPVDTSRYKQADGNIYLDFVAGHTGIVSCTQLTETNA